MISVTKFYNRMKATITVSVVFMTLATMIMLSPILANLDDADARQSNHKSQVIKQTCSTNSGSCSNVKVQTSGRGNAVTINGHAYR